MRRCSFCVFALLLIGLAQLGASAQELRGLWVVCDGLTSPAKIRNAIDLARSHHFNALFVQIRSRGDAYYQSDLEPRAEALVEQPADFDPLAEAIRQGHAAGLQVHAWLATCLVWSKGRRPFAVNHVINQHLEWLARDAQGNFRMTDGPECEGAFLTPANLAARQHIHDVFLDVARRYDIDGIHFDYVRYPNKNYDYSDAAITRFRQEMLSSMTPAQRAYLDKRSRTSRTAYAHAFPEQWQAFRRRQVTDMVASISHDIKAIKPWVIMSAAVFADSSDALNGRGQDWKTWLRRGYLDAVCPMAYGSSTAKVAAQIRDAVSVACASGRHAYIGLGAWHIPASSTIAKINVARQLGAQGCVLFSLNDITRDGQSTAYLDKVSEKCYRGVALAPKMPWLPPHPAALNAAVKAGTGSSRG